MTSNTISLNPIFTPTQVSGCQLWLDAADAPTVSLSGNNVTQWNDKSGNARNAVVSGSYFATRTSSNSGISFNNSYYTTTYTADPTNETLFVAFRSFSQSNRIMLSSPNPNGRFVGIPDTGITPVYSIGFGKDAVTWAATTPITSNADVITTVQFSSGAFSRISANGGTAATYAALTFNSGSNTNIGAALSGGTPVIQYQGLIYEIIAYNSVLSTSNTQIVEGYLAWKWGTQGALPSNHPYRNTQVVNINTIPRSLQANLPTSMSASSSPFTFFNPVSIPGCSLWLDAADPNGMTFSGSLVSSWRSKGTNPIVVTSASNNPSYVPNVYNGQSVIRFIFGSNTPFLNSSVSSSVVQTNTNHAVFIVHKPITDTSSPFGYVTSTGTNRISTHTPQGSTVAYDMGGGTGMRLTYDYGNIATYLNGALRLETFYTTSPNFTYRRDGTQLATAPASLTATFDATQLLYIGGIHPTYSGYYYGGDYCEIVWYNIALTVAQIQQVEGYLAWKWGTQGALPAGHPFKNSPPGLSIPVVPLTRQLGNRVFLPTNYSGCRLWFDANDPNSVVLSGSSVTQWTDKSGNANNASISTGTPTYVSNGIVFTGSQLFNTPLNSSMNTQSIFIITSPTSTATGDILGVNSSVIPSGFEVQTSNYQQKVIGFGNATPFTGATLTSNVRCLYGSILNGGAASFIYLNGTQTGTIGSTTTVSGAGTVTLGGYTYLTSSGFFYSGTVNEIVLYNIILTTTQRQQVEGYLAWKWGLQGSLPSNHPFSKWPPPP